MATDVERLVVQLSADVKKYENALNKAMGQTNRQARRIESRFDRMNKNISRSFTALGRGMAVAFAVAGSARGAQNLIDSATKINNALKVAGLSGKELESVYDKLLASAQKNAAPLETLVTLYSRASLVQKELNVTTEELLSFTDKVALSLRLSGQSAQEASGALLQLSQALGNGIVQAEEYNSLIDGAPLMLRAVAAGMEEAGGSVAKLTRLVKSQQVSSQAFFRAFEAGSYILEEKLAGATLTVGQEFQRFSNTLVDTAREFNKDADAASLVGRELDDLAGFITDVANAAIAGQKWLDQYTQGLGDLGSAAYKAGEQLRAILGLPNLGEKLGINKLLGTDKETQDKIQSRIAGAFANAGGVGEKDEVIQLPPISVKDYPTGGKASGGGGGGRSGGGGGGGRSPADIFGSDVEQIKARTAAIRAETEALAGLNPLVDDYGYTVQKVGAQQDLLNAAQRAGLKITPELRATIDQLADGYASAGAEAAKLAASQDEVRHRAEEMRDLGRDVMGGFIHDLMNGKSAAEALSDALGKVADRLLDMALDSLFSGKGLFGGGGGLLGGILIPGILHKGGVAGKDGYGHGRAVSPSVFAGAARMHSGGVAGLRPGEVPAILQRGEVVLPKNAKSAGGGSEIITINLQADPSVIADVADQRIKTASGTIVHVAVTQSQKQVVPTMAAYQRDRAGGDYRG